MPNKSNSVAEFELNSHEVESLFDGRDIPNPNPTNGKVTHTDDWSYATTKRRFKAVN